MTLEALRIIEAVLSSQQSEEDTADDMVLLKTMMEMRKEAENRWNYVYAAAYNFHTRKGVEAQVQIRITKTKEDFIPLFGKNEDEDNDSYVLR